MPYSRRSLSYVLKPGSLPRATLTARFLQHPHIRCTALGVGGGFVPVTMGSPGRRAAARHLGGPASFLQCGRPPVLVRWARLGSCASRQPQGPGCTLFIFIPRLMGRCMVLSDDFSTGSFL